MSDILYWSPFTSKVATVKSVINSAEILNKFPKKNHIKPYIINAVNEWDDYQNLLSEKKIITSFPLCLGCFQMYSVLRQKKENLYKDNIFWRQCESCDDFIEKCRNNAWNYIAGTECCDKARQTIWLKNGKNKQMKKKKVL